MREIPPGLLETLEQIGPDLDALGENWWLIGSAALVLSGVPLTGIADVDILTTPTGAGFLRERWGLAPAPAGASEKFRSAVFVRRSDTPLPVEVMAGFEVRTPQGWQAVSPTTRVTLAGGRYFAPSLAELGDMLALFGRPKDAERATLLNAVRGR